MDVDENSHGSAVVEEMLSLWKFSDPAESERGFREAQAGADVARRAIFTTQIARSYGLRNDFATARALLSELDLEGASAIVRAYYWLELGRTYASAAHDLDSVPDDEMRAARHAFTQSAEIATRAGLDDIAIDALHMMVFVDREPDEQITWNLRALERAEGSAEPAAKRWLASLYNNIGYALHLTGRYDEALTYFDRSKRAHLARDNQRSARIADWMTAWTLRVMGRSAEALEIQRRLERENNALGTPDAYVYDELATLYQQRNEPRLAAHYRARQAAVEAG